MWFTSVIYFFIILKGSLIHLLTHKLFQTCMSFFPLLSIREDIVKNMDNQTIAGPHWLP